MSLAQMQKAVVEQLATYSTLNQHTVGYRTVIKVKSGCVFHLVTFFHAEIATKNGRIGTKPGSDVMHAKPTRLQFNCERP